MWKKKSVFTALKHWVRLVGGPDSDGAIFDLNLISVQNRSKNRIYDMTVFNQIWKNRIYLTIFNQFKNYEIMTKSSAPRNLYPYPSLRKVNQIFIQPYRIKSLFVCFD